jgi:hypothetical protein
MKKYVIIMVVLLFIIIGSIFYAYRLYQENVNNVSSYNYNYEQYIDKEISGTEIATILNKAVNNNEQNNIQKSENNEYIENNSNSIKIDIYIKDNDTTYSMEKIYNLGVEQFINSFSFETFKIDKVEYHNETGIIKYILIKQQ